MPRRDASGPTLRALLSDPELGLRVPTGARIDADVLDAPTPWVHSSDLPNPTPFLVAGVVLLTTGTQFDAADEPAWAAYVERLASTGVAALGFGTEVIRDGIPEPLARACAVARLPLFEVPFKTPFIAVARSNADAASRSAYARRTWALQAQRRISTAALRQDGLAAALRELAGELGVWVGLFSSDGSLRHDASPGVSAGGTWAGRTARPEPAALREVGERAEALLRRGTPTAGVTDAGGVGFTLQTVGPGGALRGVLALAWDGLDHEAQGVVAAVVALVGLALAKEAERSTADATVRAAALELLLAGRSQAASAVLEATGDALPLTPWMVLVTETVAAVGRGGPGSALAVPALGPGSLAATLRSGGGSGRTVLLGADAAADAMRRLLAAAPLAWGAEDCADAAELAAAIERAGLAASVARRERDAAAGGGAHAGAFAARRSTAGGLDRTHASSGVVVHARDLQGLDPLAADGHEASLAAARALLSPVLRHDAEHRGALLLTLATWLVCDANAEHAARSLGVHRHTVRARLRALQAVAGDGLADFASRARWWSALRLLGHVDERGVVGVLPDHDG